MEKSPSSEANTRSATQEILVYDAITGVHNGTYPEPEESHPTSQVHGVRE
jgi:hypothetical protein